MHWNRDDKIFYYGYQGLYDYNAEIDHLMGGVLVPGCFDLLHYSHVDFLQRAALLGDHLTVAINSDASVRRYKPGRPLIGQKWRARQLAALEIVKGVVIFEQDGPTELIKRLKPNLVVCGAEWAEENPLFIVAAENFGQVVYLPKSEEHISTTALIERLQKVPQKE